MTNANHSLRITSEYQQNLIRVLSGYFDETDRSKLEILIKGGHIQDKICFCEDSIRLVMVFRQLHLHKLIVTKYRSTQRWICENFQYLSNTKGKSDFSADTVYILLTKFDGNLAVEKRIYLPGLKFIRKKDKIASQSGARFN